MDKKQTPNCGCGTTGKNTKEQTAANTANTIKNQANVNATRNNVKK